MINLVSRERIRDELVKLIILSPPSEGILMLEELGLLEMILPELQAAVGFEQKSPYHHEDLFRHSLSVMDRTRPDLSLRLAALFHDLGKIEAERFIARDPADEQDYYVYWGHQEGSLKKSRNIMKRLRFPKQLREEVEFLVCHHMINYQADWKDSTIRRLIRRLGPHLEKMMELFRADTTALKPVYDKAEEVRELERRIAGVRLEEVRRIKCPLDGHEIQKILGIGPGKRIGEVKEEIIGAILDGTIRADKEEARKFLIGAKG